MLRTALEIVDKSLQVCHLSRSNYGMVYDRGLDGQNVFPPIRFHQHTSERLLDQNLIRDWVLLLVFQRKET
jgi:hypothetical protein